MSQSKLKTKNRLLPVSLRNSPYLFYLQHTQNELSYNFFIKDSIAWGIIIPPEVIFYLNRCSKWRLWKTKNMRNVFHRVYVCVFSQSCLTLHDPMDCSLPGSSVRGILQVRILEWIAMSSSRGLPNSGFKPVSSFVGRCFTVWATREAQGYFLAPAKYQALWGNWFWLMKVWGNKRVLVSASS